MNTIRILTDRHPETADSSNTIDNIIIIDRDEG